MPWRVSALPALFMFAVFAATLLLAASNTFAEALVVSWTAPGDDGRRGQAAQYDIRFSPAPITEENFDDAMKFPSLFTPKPAGGTERIGLMGITPGRFYLAIKTADEAGNWSKMSNVLGKSISIEGQWEEFAMRSDIVVLGISMARPNPATSTTRLMLSLPSAAEVQLDAYDVIGRRVTTLASGPYQAGRHDVTWNLTSDRGERVEPGVYFVRGKIGEASFLRRVVVVR